MRNEDRWLIVLLTLGFFARLACGMLEPAKTADGSIVNIDHYAELAASVADHGSIANYSGQATSIREPGYPILLGLIFKIFGKGYFLFLIVQSLLSVGSLWILFRIGKEAFQPFVGLGAVAIGAFYPQFIYYSSLPVRETWMIFIDLLSLWLLSLAVLKQKRRDFLLAGLCGAIAALTNKTYLPFGLLVVPALIFLLMRGSWAKATIQAAVYMVVFMMLYATWPIRNHAVLHEWGSVTGAADQFYQFMIVPVEIGGTPDHYAILARDPVWQEAATLPPAARENFLWVVGLKKIRHEPLTYLRLVAWRFFVDQWRFAPRPRDYGHSYRLIWWASLLTDGWIIPLGFLGILFSRLRTAESIIGLAFILSISFTYSLVLTMLRYRLVIMPWMILFAALALERLYRDVEVYIHKRNI